MPWWQVLAVFFVLLVLMKVLITSAAERELGISNEFWRLSKLAGKADEAEFRTRLVEGAQKFDDEAHLGLNAKQVSRLRKAMLGSWYRKALWRLSYWGP